MPEIDKTQFVQSCAEQSVKRGVHTHYTVGVGQLRSGIKDDVVDGKAGPFGYSDADWEANRKGGDGIDLDFTAGDKTLWRAQIAVHAVMTRRAWDRCKARLGQNPSALQLYVEQWSAPDNDDTATKLQKALDDTADLVKQIDAQVLSDAGFGIGGSSLSGSFEPDGIPEQVFKSKAPKVMQDLMADFGFTDIQAAGILGNLGHECGGFTIFHEKGQPADKGGIGWAQWTGSRRKIFEKFCSDNTLDPKSDQANYGFLKHEMTDTSENKVVAPLKAATTLNKAVEVFVTVYERAGVVAMDSRNKWAKRAMDAFKG